MLGPLYLSSFLKKFGVCDVDVCDLSSLKRDDWYIPVGDIYGITGVSPQFIYMKQIIELLKGRESKPVIVGGVHATVYSDHIFKYTKADACVIGDGEEPLKAIMNGVRWREIPSVATRDFDASLSLHRSMDISDLPSPDRAAIDYFSYLVPRTFGYMDSSVKREGSIITSRGCPFSCAFCGNRKINGKMVRLMSPLRVIHELSQMVEQYGVEMVNFLDDTFIIDKKRVHSICSLMKQRTPDLKWFCLTRSDCADKGMLLEMRSAGCLSLAVGFESGSDRILSLMNKGITVTQAKASIKEISSTGLLINGQLMVGFPTETDEDVELTAKFIKESPEVDTFGLHVFHPFPGCDVWDNPNKYGIEIDKETDFYDYHTIGRHDGLYSNDPVIDARYRYLKSVIGGRSREQRK
jgi:anaerobic magnesium-protoporphyrin IX monomethyl ester cyclase